MSDEELKAALAAEYTDFSIIHTDRGRWWAVRNVQRDERGRPWKSGVSDVDADTADQLRAKLQQATDQ